MTRRMGILGIEHLCGWAVLSRLRLRYVLRGLLGDHSALHRTISIYLPLPVVRDFIYSHEVVHSLTGEPFDHEGPPVGDWCLMYGHTNEDGWEEKGLDAWWRIWRAAKRRQDSGRALPWLCDDCFNRVVLAIEAMGYDSNIVLSGVR